ncbi:hypothetical protein [Rhodococcus sp. NPDC006774]|uniref:hypothetical protein n=1 Tax=Rhodococcus sp. NPDC006774 TaxID=3157186 RepID=UPI0033D99D1F
MKVSKIKVTQEDIDALIEEDPEQQRARSFAQPVKLNPDREVGLLELIHGQLEPAPWKITKVELLPSASRVNGAFQRGNVVLIWDEVSEGFYFGELLAAYPSPFDDSESSTCVVLADHFGTFRRTFDNECMVAVWLPYRSEQTRSGIRMPLDHLHYYAVEPFDALQYLYAVIFHIWCDAPYQKIRRWL